MQSKSLGLILSAKAIRDNDLYIKILSVNDKVLSGFVYGGNSTKKRHTYQLGYFIEFNQIQKNSNSINSINGEIVKPYIESIYNDKFKSFSLLAIVSIINESVYEGVKIDNLFKSVKELVDLINKSKHWLSNYCRWLLYFLKLLGYEIDYYDKNDLKYFNLNSLSLQKLSTNNNSILFPHQLINKNRKVTYESVKSLFIIFETIFEENNLNKFNDKMPVNYLNFKNLILKQLSN